LIHRPPRRQGELEEAQLQDEGQHGACPQHERVQLQHPVAGQLDEVLPAAVPAVRVLEVEHERDQVAKRQDDERGDRHSRQRLRVLLHVAQLQGREH